MAKKKKVHIPVEEKYLIKDNCIIEARMLINVKNLKMTVQECAEEIYAHTVMYYCSEKIKKLHIDWKWLSDHANPIDMEDGGDAKHRKIVYKTIWLMVPSK